MDKQLRESLKIYFETRDEIARQAIRYFRFKSTNTPKIILDNQERILNELIQKYEDAAHRIQTIENYNAAQDGALNCNNCVFLKGNICVVDEKEIQNKDKEYCEEMFIRKDNKL